MKQKRSAWTNRLFVLAFLVLTFLCWCPLLYGSYGPTNRVLGIPSWAVLAYVFGVILFALEWIYLFFTRRAMRDAELPDIVSKLASVDTDAPVAGKEGE